MSENFLTFRCNLPDMLLNIMLPRFPFVYQNETYNEWVILFSWATNIVSFDLQISQKMPEM